MATANPTSTDKVVYDPETGRSVTVHGLGAMKGQLTIMEGIDLTKPIAEQVLKRSRKRKLDASPTDS